MAERTVEQTNESNVMTQTIEETVETEQARWQDAIYKLVSSLSGIDTIDGAGCDSGDPLDLSLTEIQQAWAIRENEVFDARAAIAEFIEDAQRWRKLRAHKTLVVCQFNSDGNVVGTFLDDRLDAAIDNLT